MNDIPSPDQLAEWNPLNELGRAELDRLRDKASTEQLKKGARVAAADEERSLVYLIQGEVIVSEPNGKSDRIEAGATAASQPLFDGRSRQAVARAESGMVLLRLPRSLFELILDEQRQSAYEVRETSVNEGSMGLVQRILVALHTGKLELPVMPKVAQRLTAMGDDGDLEELNRVLRLEPSVAGRIIQACNSPAYRRRDQAITLLREAISLLGFVTVRQLALAMTLSAPFEGKTPEARRHLVETWRDSVRVSVVAAVIAGRSTVPLDRERCLLAGLMHRIGGIPIILYAVEEGSADSGELAEALDQVGGMIGREVLSVWGFEDALAEVPECLDDARKRRQGRPTIADAVSVARILCDSTRDGAHPNGLSEADYPGVARLGLDLADPDACAALLEVSRTELRELQRALTGERSRR